MAESDQEIPVFGPVRIPVTPAMRADRTRRIRNAMDPRDRIFYDSMTLAEMIAWATADTALWLLEKHKDNEAWNHPTGRIYWLLSGARPGVLEWEQGELQVVLARKARVTPAVVAQINNMAEFDVSDYTFDETSIDSAVDICLADQLKKLRDVVIAVVKKGDVKDACKYRVSKLRRAFKRGVKIVLSHARQNGRAVHETKYRARIASLINDDLKVWSTKLTDAANSMRSESEFPPFLFSSTPVLVPTWEKLDAGIDTVGRPNEEEHAGLAHRTKRVRTASTKTSA